MQCKEGSSRNVVYHSSGLITDLEIDKYNKSVYYLRKKEIVLINIITHLHFQWPKHCRLASIWGLYGGGSCAEQQNNILFRKTYIKTEINKWFFTLLWCCWCLWWVRQCYWPPLRVSRGRAGRWPPLRHSCISCRTACLPIPLCHTHT